MSMTDCPIHFLHLQYLLLIGIIKGIYLGTHQRKSKIHAIHTSPFHLNSCPGFCGKLAGSNSF